MHRVSLHDHRTYMTLDASYDSKFDREPTKFLIADNKRYRKGKSMYLAHGSLLDHWPDKTVSSTLIE